jgi:hypothetical protein
VHSVLRPLGMTAAGGRVFIDNGSMHSSKLLCIISSFSSFPNK